MKNLLNCHCIGLHSFPIELSEDGLYKRIFYADTNHELHKPFEIAIHPHHVDITITVLEGVLTNRIFELDNGSDNVFGSYKWNSHILNGNGGFEYNGICNLKNVSNFNYAKGSKIFMKSCELHTVQVSRGFKCIWLIEESKASCGYEPINYSKIDLAKWTPEGLYTECDNETKQKYIGHLL